MNCFYYLEMAGVHEFAVTVSHVAEEIRVTGHLYDKKLKNIP